MAGGGFGLSYVAAAQVRTDIDVPVPQFITETDLALFYTARQDDNARLRTPTLHSLYPTHADYVAKVTAATDQAVSAGFVRPGDKAAIVAKAEAANVPPA
jgi:hypothetical protein